ncbi:DUF4124 domain-containing protein [Psychrobacter sp. SZ93C1]|uniref:DUF4124 domain-containing protein n=1 Tax=Psychrobacter sp. SZ93C1 TaxID=2792058 RepID=UPI0018CF84C5|nr:DUF4124 domain-containing protein [Psychrobacter sp. SZ93C1]MBH0065426.1 DUF4124 domain-containing protein [Psychrobacter sp. SZ93C1]
MISLSKLIFSKGNVGLLTAMIVSAASLYAPLANASAIYKVVDEKTGQVTFTDRPQNYEQQADKQVTQTSVMTRNDTLNSSNNSNTSGQSSSTAQAASTETTITPDADSSTVKTAVNYQLTITEPSEERAYRRPAQNIAVNVQVKPSLQAGDNVSIYLDGNEVAQGLSASIPTVDILPGSHSITAAVTNEKGKTLQQVARTIYVIQNNTTLQDNKRKAEQLLAYQNLSLYQKLLLKLRQSD